MLYYASYTQLKYIIKWNLNVKLRIIIKPTMVYVIKKIYIYAGFTHPFSTVKIEKFVNTAPVIHPGSPGELLLYYL